LLVNPSAGRGAGRRLAPEVRQRLRQAGAECEIQFTSGPGEMRVLVAAALRGGADCVAVAGGDGSMNEAVNGYVGVASENQALAVIPLGTATTSQRCSASATTGGMPAIASRAAGAGASMRAAVTATSSRMASAQGSTRRSRSKRIEIRWLRGNAVYGVALARTLYAALFDAECAHRPRRRSDRGPHHDARLRERNDIRRRVSHRAGCETSPTACST
jgi:hypothetical protein